MALFRKRTPGAPSLDEFIEGGAERTASPLELQGGAWQGKLASITRTPASPSDLNLTAFTLVRGGDLFEAPRSAQRRAPTPSRLLDTYQEERLRLVANRVAPEEREAALQGILRVLSGNPAVCRRMLLARPIDVVLIPKDRDYREYGFPPSTNPNAAGIFWNDPKDERALIGLREERILEKPWLMVHEMMHAVHLIGFTVKERQDIDAMLMPVYRSRRWVEEAVAIYAERAFGAEYSERELAAPDLYGKTRREWTDRAVFALFIEELLRPDLATRRRP
ncbi:MAG: hypothetical protein IT384_10310 [Deltaproteobacteria bacterium]|nr:hypothetical protein [Deltaproteobacteria bacterium]